MKRIIYKAIAPYINSRLSRSDLDVYQVISKAIECKQGKISAEGFRKSLEFFYQRIDIDELKRLIDFEKIKKNLEFSDKSRYKINYFTNHRLHNSKLEYFTPMGHLFSHLEPYELKCFLVILPAGEVIAPHAHQRIVSGFLCLEGAVNIRHYNHKVTVNDHLVIEKTIDTTLEPGKFTTNSEITNNIHWMHGQTKTSISFQMHLLNIPNPPSEPTALCKMIFVNPTVMLNHDGTINAPIISENEAEKIPF